MLKLYDSNNASSLDSDLFHKLISKTYQPVSQTTQVWFVLLWTKYQWQWGETIQYVCKNTLLPMSASDFTFFFCRFAYHKNNVIVLYSYVTKLQPLARYDLDIWHIKAPYHTILVKLCQYSQQLVIRIENLSCANKDT